MNEKSRAVKNVYLVLMLFNTLAASFIWGVNTLFLLDAGLSNTQAFAANAFFAAGQVIFEVPTGIVADTWGRRISFLLGTLTWGGFTLVYLWAWQIQAPFWVWAAASVFLGLGFTFFSGATEAWLVDALNYTKFKGSLESVFARGQMATGVGMLTGSVAGGFIAQSTNLGVPYILRAVVMGLTFIIAFLFMKDLGFKPKRSEKALKDMKRIFTESVSHGLKNPPVRWVMLAAPFGTGVLFYAFYAAQPYLLQLYGDPNAYGIAGLAAALVAAAQFCGGLTATKITHFFRRRTTILFTGLLISAFSLFLIGFLPNFWVAIALLAIWGLVFTATMPVRQAYINGLIPSEQRATVLSFDSLMGSSGAVVFQPVLGKVADVSGYAASYLVAGIFQGIALPFILLARREKPKSDPILHPKKD